jgi:hypothetical protein
VNFVVRIDVELGFLIVGQVKFLSMSALLGFQDARAAGVANGSSNSAQEETPLSRLYAKPFHLFSNSDTFLYLSSIIPSLIKFEISWCLSGIQLLEFSPSVFVQNIQREIPILPFSIAVSIFIEIQKKVAIDAVKFKEIVNVPIAEEWARTQIPSSHILPMEQSNIVARSPLQPVQLQHFYSPGIQETKSAVSKTKFMFGGPRALTVPDSSQQAAMASILQFPALPQALTRQSANSNFNLQFPASHQIQSVFSNSFSGQSAVNAALANSVQSAGIPDQLPFNQSAASAAQGLSEFSAHEPNDRSAVNAARGFNMSSAPSAVHAAQASPIYSQFAQSSVPSGEAALLSNPLLHQLMFTLPQYAGAVLKPQLPWQIAAKNRALQSPFIQDARLPTGYKRITMDTIIEQAKADRRRNPNKDTARMVDWPKMLAFNRASYKETRSRYYECIMEASDSGIFSSFKSTLQPVARNSAIGAFGLDNASFVALDDQVFMDWCAIYFGPANKKDAIRRLKEIRIDHRDSQHCQSSFLAKFDAVCYEHELIVNDIADSCSKWPVDESDIDCAGLTLKDLQKEWRDLFSKQEFKTFSCQIKRCRQFIDQNPEMPFNHQVDKLHAHFEKRDLAVENGDEEYTTKPEKTSAGVKRNRGDSFQSDSHASKGNSRISKSLSDPM